MNQAGLYKATLYENNNAVINYDSFTITTDGEIILFDNRPKLNIIPRLVNIDYELAAQKNDLTQSDIDTINNSIYGWIVKFDFFNGNAKIVERPFFNFTSNQLNTNQSHSREITLKSWNKRGLVAFS